MVIKGSKPNIRANIFFVLISGLAFTLISSILFLTYKYLNFVDSRKVAAACKNAADACVRAAGLIAHNFETPAQIIVTFFLLLIFLVGIKSFLAPILLSLRIKNSKPINLAKYPLIENPLKKLFKTNLPGVYLFNTHKPVAYAFGIFKSSICVSRGIIERLNEEELESLIFHEAAHIIRRDVFFIWIATILRDLMFILPISHLLVRRFIYEKEHAADEFAIKFTKNPVSLALAIVKVSKMGKNLSPAALPTFSQKITVESRVKQLLGISYKPVYSARSLALSIVASLVIVMSIVGIAFALPRSNHPSTVKGCSSMSQCQGAAVNRNCSVAH